MPDSDLVVRSSWWTRLLRTVGLLPTGEVEHLAGADFSPDLEAFPTYDPAKAMSGYVLPWPAAATNARAADLSGLPLRAARGRGSNSEILDDHPALQLLRRPSSRVSEVLFRRQLVVDLTLSGTWYGLIARDGQGRPVSLLRMAPQRVRVKPWADGQPGVYKYDGGSSVRTYQWDEVLHVRSPSWEDTPAGQYGLGATQVLHNGLVAEMEAKKQSATASKLGRPTGIISPAKGEPPWSQKQIEILRSAYEKQMSGSSGVLFVGGGLDYEAMSWSPRDMEWIEQSKLSREETLAVLDVPPARVHLPNANYATDTAQRRGYWKGLQGLASLLDSELSRLAGMFGDSDVRLYHDFADVEELQESRTARLERVGMWVMELGASPSEAASYEGFDDAPVSDEAFSPSSAEPETERASSTVAEAFGLDAVEAEAFVVPVGEEDRAMVWRAFLDKVHEPSERELLFATSRFLKQQGRRVAARLGQVLEQRAVVGGSTVIRDLTEAQFIQIMDESGELVRHRRATRSTLRRMLRRAYQAAVIEIGVDSLPEAFPEVSLDAAVTTTLGDLVVNVGDTTKAAVRKIVNTGIAEGATVAEMQGQLMSSSAFSARRALRIARTETTRSVNAGALVAYDEAADLGIHVRKQWLTARDGGERHPAYEDLDGQTVETGEAFDVGGFPAMGPGDSSLPPSESVNCRCTVIPIVME